MMAPDRGVASRLRSAQRFRRKRPRDRPTQPQSLAVEPLDRLARSRKGPVDARYQIGKQTFVDRELPVSKEFHQDGAQQRIIGRAELDRRQSTQARSEI